MQMNPFTDVTSLLQSEDVYTWFFTKSSERKILAEVGTSGIFDINESALKFLGFESFPEATLRLKDIFPETTIETFSALSSRNGAKTESRNKVTIKLSDKSLKEVEVNISSFLLSGKYLLEIHLISSSLPDEEKNLFSEQLFLQFVTSTPVAVAMFDSRMNYLLVSDRWVSDFKVNRGEIIGRSHYEVFPNQPHHWIASHQRALKGHAEKFEQDIFIHPNGKLDWIRWEILPWYTSENKVGGVIIFNEMITQRKKAEEISNRLIEQRSRMAAKVETIEEERRNIARELHDGLGQLLTAAHLNLVLIEQDLENDPDKVKEDLKRVKNLVTTTIQEVRNISQNLRPAVLDDFGLVPAVRNLCDEFSQTGSLRVRFSEYEVQKHYSPGIEIAVYRICQESLNNIVKHSNATEASVELYNRQSHILIVIQDNGTGFDTRQISKSKNGSGLLNIQERAELLGGRVQIESQPNNGTEVIIEIPLRKNNDLLSIQDEYE